MNESNAFPIKIIVVGSINVGKTSLVIKYATGKTSGKTQTTKNSSYVEKIKIVNGIKFQIKLWDTAGQEKYKSLTKLYTKDAKIAILVYSIDNEQSFNDLDDWFELVKNSNDANILYGIAANKSDLVSENTISDERGKEYAKKIGAEWRLTSALVDGSGIEEYIDVLFIKYYYSNFGPASRSRSITLSIENARIYKRTCCGGLKIDNNNNTKNHHKRGDSKRTKKQ